MDDAAVLQPKCRLDYGGADDAVKCMLNDQELLQLAGNAAFARGRAYCAEDRVHLVEHTSERLSGKVEGTHRYEFWLKLESGKWRWSCSCPAADDGSFCKHLVAAALTSRGDNADGISVKPARDDLLEFLRAQTAERL